MQDQASAVDFDTLLEAHGVSRRSFMKLCGAVAVAAGLGSAGMPKVAHALEDKIIGATEGKLFPAIWIEGACAMGVVCTVVSLFLLGTRS